MCHQARVQLCHYSQTSIIPFIIAWYKHESQQKPKQKCVDCTEKWPLFIFVRIQACCLTDILIWTPAVLEEVVVYDFKSMINICDILQNYRYSEILDKTPLNTKKWDFSASQSVYISNNLCNYPSYEIKPIPTLCLQFFLSVVMRFP